MEKMRTLKPLLIVSILLLLSKVSAQTIFNDTTKIRWITIDFKDYYSQLDLKENVSELNVLKVVEIAAKQKDEVFFIELNSIEQKTKMYPKLIDVLEYDSIISKSAVYQINTNFNEDNSILISIDDSSALVDEKGDPIIVYCGGYQAWECYCYMPKSTFQFPLERFETIKIREELKFDSNLNDYVYKPVGITFSPCYLNYYNFDLWVDLSKLGQHQDLSALKWYSFIMDQLYEGKIYMLKE